MAISALNQTYRPEGEGQQYYVIWVEGKPFYANPNTGHIYDDKGQDTGYTAAYNQSAGQWEITGPYGSMYLGTDWTLRNKQGNPVGYVSEQPTGAVGTYSPGADYFEFMHDTGRSQGVYQPGPQASYGQAQRTPQQQQAQSTPQQQASYGQAQSNPALEELYKLLMQAYTSQSTTWENTLNALLQSLGTTAGRLSQIGTPAYYQQLYNTAWKALEQPRAQAQEALRQAYASNIPGVLDTLAGAGIINSTTGAQALAALAAQYLQALAQQQAQWAQVAPQYIQAGTGAAEQGTRQAMAMPSSLLSVLQAMPGSGLSAIQQLIGLFDLLGSTFV